MDWKQSTPPHDAGALGNRGIKQGSSQHNLKKLLGKANSGELPYLMNTTGQADVSGLAPLNEKPPLLKETLLYADLFDLSPPHQPHQMRLFYDWSESSMTPIAKYITAFVIALVLASGHLLDGPSELDAVEAVEADLQDAIKTAQVQR